MGNATVCGESNVDLKRIRETPSTVLVPLALVNGMLRLQKRKGLGVRGLLRLLLDDYAEIGGLAASWKAKKLYLVEGLELQRVDFRPANGDWASATPETCSSSACSA